MLGGSRGHVSCFAGGRAVCCCGSEALLGLRVYCLRIVGLGFAALAPRSFKERALQGLFVCLWCP